MPLGQNLQYSVLTLSHADETVERSVVIIIYLPIYFFFLRSTCTSRSVGLICYGDAHANKIPNVSVCLLHEIGSQSLVLPFRPIEEVMQRMYALHDVGAVCPVRIVNDEVVVVKDVHRVVLKNQKRRRRSRYLSYIFDRFNVFDVFDIYSTCCVSIEEIV